MLFPPVLWPAESGAPIKRNIMNMWMNCAGRTLRVLSLYFQNPSNDDKRKFKHNWYAHEPSLKRKGKPPTSGHDGGTGTGFTLPLDTTTFVSKKRDKIYGTIVFRHVTIDRADTVISEKWETIKVSPTTPSLLPGASFQAMVQACGGGLGWAMEGGLPQRRRELAQWGQDHPSEIAAQRTGKSCMKASRGDPRRVALTSRKEQAERKRCCPSRAESEPWAQAHLVLPNRASEANLTSINLV